MIKKLHLKHFGRFNDKTFNFAPVTLFVGRNESGKTTLFDALLDAICRPKGNMEYGKKLNARYLKERDAKIEYEGEPFSIEEADFLNLFAIRSGEIKLDPELDSQWMNNVKASLFSGGINPQAVADELDKKFKSKAKDSLNSEEKKLSEELKEFELKKEKELALRQECLNEEKRIAGAEGSMAQSKDEIANLEKERRELERIIEQQGFLQQRKNIKSLLADITERRRYKDELEKYARFNPVVLEDLKNREAEVIKLNGEVKKAAILEEETLRKLSDNAGEKAGYEKEKFRVDSIRLLADTLQETLVPREKLVKTVTRRIWRKPFFAAAGLFVIAGAIIFIIKPDSWIFTAATFALAVICAVIAPVRRTFEDSASLDEAVKAAQRRWKNETGEDAGNSYEDILLVLTRAAERSRTTAEKHEQVIDKNAAIEKEMADRALNKQMAANAEEEAKKQMQKLLEVAGVTNIPDYAAMLKNKENITERCKELDEKLRAALAENKASTLTELEEIMSRRMENIDNKITDTEIPPHELGAKQNRLKTVKDNVEKLNHKINEENVKAAEDTGEIKGRFKGVPERIAEYEKGIMERKHRLEEIKKELRAIKIAQELFVSMEEDSTAKMEQLSGEITEQFSSLTAVESKVSMTSYSIEKAGVSDAGGNARSMDYLSAGTKDAFLLASRLVLARKSVNTGKSAIIILDEPFITLDKPRTERALALLENFQKTTSWQIIIFTKEEETEKQAQLIFGSNLSVIKLP
jgi:DNA sulfur modification protein DndD